MFIALIGLGLVIKMRSVEHVSSLAVILTIMASFSFACYHLLAKQLAKFNLLTLFSYLSLIIFPVAFLLSFFQEEWPSMEEVKLQSIMALLYIVVIGTLLGDYIWFYLLNKYPMSKVVPFTLLSPIFGCIITKTVLNEHISLSVLVGGLLVMTGLALIQLKRG